MKERVTASFAVVGTITPDKRETLESLLGSMLEISDTEVTLWDRPSKPGSHTSDGVAVVGTVEAEDEFEALANFSCTVRAALDVVGWRLDVARLDVEVVRVVPGLWPAALAAVPAQREKPETPAGSIDAITYEEVAA